MLIKTCSSFLLLEAESKRLLTARVLTRHLGHCSLVHTYEVTRPSIILYSLLIVPVGTPAWRAATGSVFEAEHAPDAPFRPQSDEGRIKRGLASGHFRAAPHFLSNQDLALTSLLAKNSCEPAQLLTESMVHLISGVQDC